MEKFTIPILRKKLKNLDIDGLNKMKKNPLVETYKKRKYEADLTNELFSKNLKYLRPEVKKLGVKGVYKLNKKELIKKIVDSKVNIKDIDKYINDINNELSKIELDADKVMFIEDIYDMLDDIEKNKIYRLLRKNRVLKSDIGIIIQHPIEDLDSEEFKHFTRVEELIESSYNIKYVDMKYNDILNYSLDKIFNNNNNNIISGFGSIQAFYGYNIKGTEETRGRIGFAYSVMHDLFNENNELKKVGYDTTKDIVFNYPASVYIVQLGYRILFKINGKLTNTEIRKLKAYQPSIDRKYHEQTSSSTSTNKLCIYESFLDIIDKRNLIYKKNRNNIDDLKQLLKEEGLEIEDNVKKGNLIDSLILLTKKYDESILISFYNESKYIIISNGDVNENPSDDDILKFDNKKSMLYERNIHVAPFKFIRNDNKKIQKENDNYYKLRSKTIKNNSEKEIEIYGYDCETYCNFKGEAIPYCITLYGEDKNKNIIRKSFYGEKCIDEFCAYIDEISSKVYYFKSRPKESVKMIYIYGFNNSNFDNILIYDNLYKRNNKIKYIFTKSSIKFIEYNNIRISDISLFYKAGSLRDTCTQFKLEEEKGVFPYKFPNKDNLYYEGEVPELKYWNDKKDYDEYIENNGNTFNMKEYTEKYCLLDSKLVYELGKRHLKNCIGEVNGRQFNLLKANTSANIALKMFTQCFLDTQLNESTKENIIKEKRAYKGGRTEKFKSIFESKDVNDNLYYFDINSSYPFSMTKLMPYKFIKKLTVNNKEINNDNLHLIVPYNLYKAKFKYIGNKEINISNLLIRDEKTKEIIAVNESDDYDYHWGCELIEAVKNDFKINICEENEYEGKNLFSTYVKYVYDQKTHSKKKGNTSLSMFYKLLLNSLYGKFGQKIFNKTCLCNSNEEVFKILEEEKGKLVNFNVYKDIFMIEYKTNDTQEKSIGKLVRLSSYIAAESRCTLSNFMRDVGHENVYYCDTDSVFTSKRPSENLINSDILGKWKEETQLPIKRACFIAPKTYTYTCRDDKKELKAKGLNAKKIDESQYYDLVNGKINNIPQNMTMFFRTFDSIVIKDQERTMNNVNNKRIWCDNYSKSFKNIDDWKKSKCVQFK